MRSLKLGRVLGETEALPDDYRDDGMVPACTMVCDGWNFSRLVWYSKSSLDLVL